MSFSPGRLLYLLYHRPRTAWRDARDRAAGRRGESEMRAAAAALPPVTLATWGLSTPPVRFLTGSRFVHQTIFCARSFAWACGSDFHFEIFDDGTLAAGDLALLRAALPHVAIVDPQAVASSIDDVLPREIFPHLRALRETHPLMRKLLDLHAGRRGPALYLDSDMLFFGSPRTLIDWLCDPSREYFMQQFGDALVSDRPALGQRLSLELLPGVNSGILALDDGGFDWPALERAAALLTPSERAHKWAEQTLFAIHLSRRGALPLSRAGYFLCHNREDFSASRPPPVLCHYVHKSKWRYTAGEWRRWLARSAASPAGPA